MASNAKTYKKGDLKTSDIANDPVLKKNQEDKLFGRNNSQGKGSWSRIDTSDKQYIENFDKIFGKKTPWYEKRDEEKDPQVYLDMYLSDQIDEAAWYKLCQSNQNIQDYYLNYIKRITKDPNGTK